MAERFIVIVNECLKHEIVGDYSPLDHATD